MYLEYLEEKVAQLANDIGEVQEAQEEFEAKVEKESCRGAMLDLRAELQALIHRIDQLEASFGKGKKDG